MRVLNSFAILLFSAPCFINVDSSTRVTVLTKEPTEFLYAYYLEIWDEDPPSEFDSAKTDAQIRLRICEGIHNNRVFPLHNQDYEYKLVDQRDPAQRQSTEVTNQYRLEKFKFKISAWAQLDVEEYVFPCLLKEIRSNDIVPYYVSKSYSLQHDIRFIFMDTPRDAGHSLVLLAEKSSQPYARPTFNVELHYLELRKRHRLSESFDADPVCKFSTADPDEDQHIRLCTVIFGSAHFKDEVLYMIPTLHDPWACYVNRVRFRTEEALEAVAGKMFEYNERVAHCNYKKHDETVGLFYMSRGYNPHEVFVYARNSTGGNFYLETLFTDVSVVQERYNFGEVET